MGPLSYMRSAVDRNVGIRFMTVIGNTVLGCSGFQTRNNSSENNPQFRHTVRQSCPSSRKIIGLKSRLLFNVPGAPKFLR